MLRGFQLGWQLPHELLRMQLHQLGSIHLKRWLLLWQLRWFRGRRRLLLVEHQLVQLQLQ